MKIQDSFHVYVNIDDPIGAAVDKEGYVMDILRRTYAGRNYKGKHIMEILDAKVGHLRIDKTDPNAGATAEVRFKAVCSLIMLDDIIPRVHITRSGTLVEFVGEGDEPVSGLLEEEAPLDVVMPVTVCKSSCTPNSTKISVIAKSLKPYEPVALRTGGKTTIKAPIWTWNPALEKIIGLAKPKGIDFAKGLDEGTWIQPNPLYPIVIPVVDKAPTVHIDMAVSLWTHNMDNYGNFLSQATGLRKVGESYLYNGSG